MSIGANDDGGPGTTPDGAAADTQIDGGTGAADGAGAPPDEEVLRAGPGLEHALRSFAVRVSVI
jgi:hypothetical protein